MPPTLLETFFAEIDGLWRLGHDIEVVECDVAIRRCYPYEGRPPQVALGGGGTRFDAPVARAAWARRRHIDERGIQFVLTFPEAVTGRRTTPRTLVQFFGALEGVEELEPELPLVRTLAQACLDAETVAAFTTFVQQGLHRLPGPVALLGAVDFAREVATPLRELVLGEVLRVDILAGLFRRLVNELQQRQGNCTESELDNLKAFLQLDFLPNELRLGLMQRLVDLEAAPLETLAADPRLGKLLLDR